jgi:hypothetical protein
LDKPEQNFLPLFETFSSKVRANPKGTCALALLANIRLDLKGFPSTNPGCTALPPVTKWKSCIPLAAAQTGRVHSADVPHRKDVVPDAKRTGFAQVSFCLL